MTTTMADTQPYGVTWSLPDDDVITVSAGGTVGMPTTGLLSNGPYTVSSTWSDISTTKVYPSGTLRLTGDDADIDINGVSLNETLRAIQDRLAILRPNAELESRWQELRDLREQYQRLEAEIREKEQAWSLLQRQG